MGVRAKESQACAQAAPNTQLLKKNYTDHLEGEKGEEVIGEVWRRVGTHILHGEGVVFCSDLEDHLEIFKRCLHRSESANQKEEHLLQGLSWAHLWSSSLISFFGWPSFAF